MSNDLQSSDLWLIEKDNDENLTWEFDPEEYQVENTKRVKISPKNKNSICQTEIWEWWKPNDGTVGKRMLNTYWSTGEIILMLDKDFDLTIFEKYKSHTFSLYSEGEGELHHTFNNSSSIDEDFELNDNVNKEEFLELIESGEIGTDENNVTIEGDLIVDEV